MKAWHLSRQGAQPQAGAGSSPHSPNPLGRKTQGLPPHRSVNPGGPMIRAPSSLVGARDEQTPNGDESGDTQDVTSQSGSLSKPQTGTKKHEDNEGEAVVGASQVTGNASFHCFVTLYLRNPSSVPIRQLSIITSSLCQRSPSPTIPLIF